MGQVTEDELVQVNLRFSSLNWASVRVGICARVTEALL